MYGLFSNLAFVWHLDQTNPMLECEVPALEELPNNKGSQDQFVPLPHCVPVPLNALWYYILLGARIQCPPTPGFSLGRLVLEFSQNIVKKRTTSFSHTEEWAGLRQVNVSDHGRKNWNPSHRWKLMSLKSVICHRISVDFNTDFGRFWRMSKVALMRTFMQVGLGRTTLGSW